MILVTDESYIKGRFTCTKSEKLNSKALKSINDKVIQRQFLCDNFNEESNDELKIQYHR